MVIVTAHAVQRYLERVERVDYSHAESLIMDIVERGHEPRPEDWLLFGVTPTACKKYLIHYRIMVVIDTEYDRVVTVMHPKREKSHKVPPLRSLRGMPVREALRQYYVEDRA